MFVCAFGAYAKLERYMNTVKDLYIEKPVNLVFRLSVGSQGLNAYIPRIPKTI